MEKEVKETFIYDFYQYKSKRGNMNKAISISIITVLIILAFVFIVSIESLQGPTTTYVSTNDFLDRYGPADSIIQLPEVITNPETGYLYNTILIYHLPYNEQRYVFAMNRVVSGIAIYRNNQPIRAESIPLNEPLLFHYKKMFPDFLVI